MAKRIFPKRTPRWFLREWREEKGLTQEQVAALVGSHQMTVSRWERWGEKGLGRRPDLNALAAFAEALGVSVRDLQRHPRQPSLDELVAGQSPEVVDQAVKIIKAILQ